MKKPKAPKGKRAKLAKVKLNLPPPWTKISETTIAKSAYKKAGVVPVVFEMPAHPPGVKPSKDAALAMDEAIIETNAWAAQQVYNGAFFNGVTFLGYTYLAELAQRPEYRRISEVLAEEATRKWIKLHSTANGDRSKADKINELGAELIRLDIEGCFRATSEIDGFFGRSHLYIDTGSSDNRDELKISIGDGADEVTLGKFKGEKGFLKAVKPIEPVWCYPANYNANDPLKPDWYNPQSWFVQGKEIHVSRLLTFIGRPVPDLLKPAYSFGGLSLSQMVKPYVDNWLRTRQAVADLIWSFSVRGLKTNMQSLMAADGDEFFRRMALFTNNQNNQGMMMIDKDSEEFFNITTPLSSLDVLQAQSQEHMCSISATPGIKLLGIQPQGFNASSEGEMMTWYDRVEAYQKRFISRALTTIINFVMLSLWGEVDPDITHSFVPLRTMTAKELAEIRKADAETDAVYLENGVLTPHDVRNRLAEDPDSPYDGLDTDGELVEGEFEGETDLMEDPAAVGGEEDADRDRSGSRERAPADRSPDSRPGGDVRAGRR